MEDICLLLEVDTAILGDGLEEIREEAFRDCLSLVRISIPPAVRVIKVGAFMDCSGLLTVSLGH